VEAAQSPAAASPLLTYDAPPNAVFHAQGVSGTLTVEEGCLYLRSGAQRFLLIFPAAMTRWDQAAQQVDFAGRRLSIGEQVEFRGSARTNRDPAGLPSDRRAGCDDTNTFAIAGSRAP